MPIYDSSPPSCRRVWPRILLLCVWAFVGVCLLGVFWGTSSAQAQSAGPSVNDLARTALSESSSLRAPDLIFGLFIGVMLTASLYLFFIWIAMRDRGQVYLMLLLLCLAVNMASTNESMTQLLGLYSISMRNLLQSYSMILAYFFSLFFTYHFLEIEENAPYMKIPLTIFAGLLLLMLVFAAFNQNPVHFVLPTLGVLSVSVVLMTGLLALRSGISGGLSHLTAFTFFLIGCLAPPLYDLGYLEKEANAQNFTYLGFSMAALMFAIVIAGQFAARQEEKERELEISNERFSLAARGSNEGLFDWNRVTDEIYASEQLRRILGISADIAAMKFKDWLKIVVPSDRGNIFTALRKLREAQGTSTISFEYRIIKGEKERRWVHTKMVSVKDRRANGQAVRFVGSIGDVTQRKRSEAEVRASEARFRSITEAHPVPVLISNLQDGNILYASPGAEKLLGLPNGTLISHRIDRFLTRALERKEILTAMTANQEVNMKEVTITCGDGDTLPAALSARRINYQNEAAMVIGLYDLTERKKAEVQIAQQQEALQQSEKMAALGGLLAGVAHELNNPLSVVMGQTTLLMEGQTEDKTKSRAEKIFKAADRCSRIVKSFLALARRKAPERKSVDLNNIIHASLELLSYQFRNENVTLKLDLDPTLAHVNGDGDQLTQVFTNLALNAAQAMHEWSGLRNLTISSRPDSGDTVLVSVVDTGPGVPADLRKRVFEPFFTTKGGLGGTGVGLALCLNIIEGHGGRMELEETSGGGATFLIHFPALVSEVAVSENSAVPVGTGESTIGKLKILLVDDEVELAQTLADLLEPFGHEVDLAANGAIALEKLQKQSFDVIISDLRMPVLDGPGLYAALAQSLPRYLTKIVYVTGDTLSPHVNAFLSETPVPVIEKPYRIADVQTALVKLLKDEGSQSTIGAG